MCSATFLHQRYMLSLYRKHYPTEVLLKGKTCDCESRDMGQQSSDQLLLATRLTIPPVRSDLVARPRLVRSLEACMQHPLTLLAAPAGFGKTALLSTWARQQQRSVGWVSLDSSDNDPAQFWTYVLTVLDTAWWASCSGRLSSMSCFVSFPSSRGRAKALLPW